MCEHYLKQGGISHYEDLAEKRAKLFYDYLDNSSKVAFNNEDGNNLVFANSVHERLRSRMNIPFSLQTADGQAANPEQLEAFLAATKAAGMHGLNTLPPKYVAEHGAGCMRASMYNPLQYESVVELCEFLEAFQKGGNLANLATHEEAAEQKFEDATGKGVNL